MHEATSPDFELVLRRVAAGARLLGLTWWAGLSVLVIVENRAGGLERPLVAVTAAVVAVSWAAITATSFARSPMSATSAPVVVGDVALGMLAILAPSLAYGGTPRVLFAGGFPFIVVLVASIRSARAGWTAAAMLGAATLAAVAESSAAGASSAGASSAGASSEGGPSLAFPVSQVLVYLAGAFIVAWAMRVLRSSDAEIRAAQAALSRAEERADISRHLHDSVLQSLALIQRATDRPDEVVRLARRQERELRSYLHGAASTTGDRLGAAVQRAAAEIEERYGTPIEVVAVGDPVEGPAVEALVAAGREAMVNAAKHAASEVISVYAEGTGGVARLYVRDRGVGFEPEAVAADRMGIRGSIVERLERIGGTAEVRAEQGSGTEWRLEVPV